MALGAAGIVARSNWPKPPPSGPTLGTVFPGPAASADPALDWNDGSAEQIRSLREGLDQLAPRAQRLWDMEPTSDTNLSEESEK